MKKTILLLCCTILITGVLFFSGAYLLELVAMSDSFSLSPASGTEGGGDLRTDSGVRTGVPGFSFFNPRGIDASSDFANVLRGFKQNTGDPINVLALASDGGGLTDAIMIMHFNPKTSQFNILSVPRDTYVTVQGYKHHKINAVYQLKNGAAQLAALLEGMLGQKIDYYIRLDLKTIREIVDLLGGVEYDVPCDMIYTDPDQNLKINLKKGRRTLTGKQVEGLLRFRKPDKWTKEVERYYDGSDLKRIERQHDFFNEMLKQKLNVKYVGKINDIIENVYSNVATDLPLGEMLKLARGLPGLSTENFRTATLPGSAKTIDGASYYIHDPAESAALAESLLK